MDLWIQTGSTSHARDRTLSSLGFWTRDSMTARNAFRPVSTQPEMTVCRHAGQKHLCTEHTQTNMYRVLHACLFPHTTSITRARRLAMSSIITHRPQPRTARLFDSHSLQVRGRQAGAFFFTSADEGCVWRKIPVVLCHPSKVGLGSLNLEAHPIG